MNSTKNEKGWSIFDDTIDRAVKEILLQLLFEKSSSSQHTDSNSRPSTSRRSSSEHVEASEGPQDDEEDEGFARTPENSNGIAHHHPGMARFGCAFCKKYRSHVKDGPACWTQHSDFDENTGEYVCKYLRKRAGEKNGHRRFECAYCRKMDNRLAIGHLKKCPILRVVTCPEIRQLPPCQKCGAYGDNGHTTKTCPKNPSMEQFAEELKRASGL